MLKARGVGIPKNKSDMVELLDGEFSKGKIKFSVRIFAETIKESP